MRLVTAALRLPILGLLLASILGPTLIAAPALAEPATCTWLRLSPDGAHDGPCEVERTDEGARITADGRDWRIRERDRQGQWAQVTINGQEAMRFETDRTRHGYATVDLNEFLDVVLQGME